MNTLNVDYDTVFAIIDFLEQELQIVEFNKTDNPRNPTWIRRYIETNIANKKTFGKYCPVYGSPIINAARFCKE